MSAHTRDDLRRALAAKNIEPLYLLYGAEDFLRDRAARAITDAALAGAAAPAFNEATYNLNSNDVQAVIAAAEQLPMMAARRVVRVTDFTKMSERDEEILVRYVTRPATTSVVIFIADELDKRRRLSKALLNACYAVEFPVLTPAELTAWGRSALKESKATIDDRTLAHVIALVGANARTLSIELGKLATAALPSGHITFDLVEALTARSRELSNFELADHLIAGDRRRALETLQILFEDKAEPLMLLGLIASQYRRLSLAKEMMTAGAPNNEVFRVISLLFNKREDFLATARRADAARLARGIVRIAETDVAIKTSLGGGGASGSRLQLEMLVGELTGEQTASAASYHVKR
ncbi:MAG: DNA polymerase III subunit delta [Pyrinomonadaceae bacterium MAG19_C2-C3]|nr:DNA polymerase III subunit delta [Pyrinomonadaceae bacterium MAG19_C2-C3]